MKITGQLGALLLALFLCGAFVLVLCLTFWLDEACMNEHRRIAMKAAGAVGCFEFWLNRYQTLLAATIAVATAAIVLRPALAQVSELKRQNSATAAQLLRFEMGTIEDELQFLDKIRDTLRDLRIAIDDAVAIIAVDQTPLETEAVLNGHINSVTFLRVELRNFAILISGGPQTADTRSQLMNWLNGFNDGERARIYAAYSASNAAPATEHDLAVKEALDTAQQVIKSGFEKIGSHSKALTQQKTFLAQQAAAAAKAAINPTS